VEEIAKRELIAKVPEEPAELQYSLVFKDSGPFQYASTRDMTAQEKHHPRGPDFTTMLQLLIAGVTSFLTGWCFNLHGSMQVWTEGRGERLEWEARAARLL